MTFARMIKLIEKRRDAVGKERDKLDAMVDELMALRETCDAAWHDLQSAIDHLSEQA